MQRLSNHFLGGKEEVTHALVKGIVTYRDLRESTTDHWNQKVPERSIKYIPRNHGCKAIGPGRHVDLWSMAKASILSSNGPWIWQSYINQHPAQIHLVLLFKDPSCPVRNVPPRIATEDQLLQELQGGAHDLWITCCSTLWMSDRSDRW